MNPLSEILLATDRKDIKAVKGLLKKYPYLYQVECAQGWPVIHRCIDDPVNQSCLDLELVKHYITWGGDVNQKAGGGVSLLFLVSMHFESKTIADFLIGRGACMSRFETAVCALFRGEKKSEVSRTVSRLISEDACLIRQSDYYGYTLLHHAVRHYHYQLVPFLLDEGADINAQTHDGKTVLWLCGMKPTERAVVACRTLLVDRGAKLSPIEQLAEMIYFGKDEEAIRRFDLQPEFRNAWISYGCGMSLLHVAVWVGRSDKVVEYLLSHGVDPDMPDNQGQSPLFQIAHRVNADRPVSLAIIHCLKDHGANLNYRDPSGCTPLHAMAAGTDEEALKLLVELGADINAQADDGSTPLDVVYQMSFLGGRSLAHWMKSRGAKSGKRKTKRLNS